MAPFNFMIHYHPGVKMDHVDFASQMDTFLSKDSTGDLSSTLRVQKQPELIPPKQIRLPVIKTTNLNPQ